MADLHELVELLRADSHRTCVHDAPCTSHSVDFDALQRLADDTSVAVHVAVMVEPYLSFVVDGRKRIESRLTKNRIAPFGRAASGDIVLFKRSGGPITAVAFVGRVLHRETRSSEEVGVLASRYADGLSYEVGYADSKRDARYATLLWLRDVTTLQVPLALKKRGRQSWVTVEPTDRRVVVGDDVDQQPALF